MADVYSLPKLFLYRTQETLDGGKDDQGRPALGIRGYMMAGAVSYYTIERSGGYVTLPNGMFELTMEEYKYPNKEDGTRRQFRVKAEGELGHNVPKQGGGWAGILIHRASYPKHLLGCVAPGKTKITNGISQSKEAMEEIFNFCGGFGVGNKAILVVGNLGEETETESPSTGSTYGPSSSGKSYFG